MIIMLLRIAPNRLLTMVTDNGEPSLSLINASQPIQADDHGQHRHQPDRMRAGPASIRISRQFGMSGDSTARLRRLIKYAEPDDAQETRQELQDIAGKHAVGVVKPDGRAETQQQRE